MTSRLVVLILTITVAAGCRALTTPTSCSGGAELVANGCYCAKGELWNGLSCQGTPDPTGCSSGYWFGPAANAGGGCFCLLGYSSQNGQCVQLQCTGGAVAGDSQCVCPDGTQWDGSQCQAVQQQQTCTGGATWDGSQCVCAAGTAWDGNQCAAQGGDAQTCTGGATWDGTLCVCQGGSTWDGTQCVCPVGTSWDGNQCAGAAAPPPPPPPSGKQCRAKLLQKGYPPDTLSNCEGVNDRCALAVLNKGYPPDTLANCRGVEGACAEQVIAKGYPPDQLANCRR